MTPQFWINAALRSVIWLGAAVGYAYFKKPDGASLLAVRTDAIGWLGGGVVFASLILHFWSTATLARGERQEGAASTPVTDGPFRYVRNPIYLAGITLLLGVGLLYSPWRAMDLGLPLLLLVYFHVAVVRVEEPELRQRFGAKYEEYCERVPRWIPVPRFPARTSFTSTTDEKFLATLKSWFGSQREILVLIRYPYAAGATNFEFFSSFQSL